MADLAFDVADYIRKKKLQDFIGPTIKQATRGMITPGNIDLTRTPRIKNPDGSVSTVRSMSFGDDQGETLVPTVSPTGILDDEQAVDQYRRTGQHLGVFDTPENATAYAEQLHNAYAAGEIPHYPPPQAVQNAQSQRMFGSPQPQQSQPDLSQPTTMPSDLTEALKPTPYPMRARPFDAFHPELQDVPADYAASVPGPPKQKDWRLEAALDRIAAGPPRKGALDQTVSKGRNIGSILAGIGTGILGGPYAGMAMHERLRHPEFTRQMEEWQRQFPSDVKTAELGIRSDLADVAQQKADISQEDAETRRQVGASAIVRNMASANRMNTAAQIATGPKDQWFKLVMQNGSEIDAHHDMTKGELDPQTGKPLGEWIDSNHAIVRGQIKSMTPVAGPGGRAGTAPHTVFQYLNEAYNRLNNKPPGDVPPFDVIADNARYAAHLQMTPARQAAFLAQVLRAAGYVSNQNLQNIIKTGGGEIPGAPIVNIPPLGNMETAIPAWMRNHPLVKVSTPEQEANLERGEAAVREETLGQGGVQPIQGVQAPTAAASIQPGQVIRPGQAMQQRPYSPHPVSFPMNPTMKPIYDAIDVYEQDPNALAAGVEKVMPQAQAAIFKTAYPQITGHGLPSRLGAVAYQQELGVFNTMRNSATIRRILAEHPEALKWIDPLWGSIEKISEKVGTSLISGVPREEQRIVQELGTAINLITSSEAVVAGRGRIGQYLIDFIKASAPKMNMNVDRFLGALDGVEDFARSAKLAVNQERYAAGGTYKEKASSPLPPNLRQIGTETISLGKNKFGVNDDTMAEYVMDKETGQVYRFMPGVGYEAMR